MTPHQTIVEMLEKKIEEWAALEHARWAKWQAYLHSKCVEHSDGKGECVCFPAESFRRWQRQIETPYSELSEKEKQSDREQVMPYIKDFISLIPEIVKVAQMQEIETIIRLFEQEYQKPQINHRNVFELLDKRLQALKEPKE